LLPSAASAKNICNKL